MVTISTVGYGDWAPTTTLGRMFSCVMIIAGVIFFSTQANEFLALEKTISIKGGRFRPGGHPLKRVWFWARELGSGSPEPVRSHVLVCGGMVHRGGPMLFSFIEEILHKARGKDAPQASPAHAASPTGC